MSDILDPYPVMNVFDKRALFEAEQRLGVKVARDILFTEHPDLHAVLWEMTLAGRVIKQKYAALQADLPKAHSW